MIRRLRLKFVLLNMLLTTVVLATALSFIYGLAAENLRARSISTMREVATLHLSVLHQFYEQNPDFPTGTAEGERSTSLLDATFIVYVDGADNAYQVEGLTDAPEDQEGYLNTIIRQVHDAGEPEGILSELDLRYLSVPTSNGHKMVFLDMAQENTSMRLLRLTMLAVGAGAVALLLLASCISSRVMVRPVERSMTKQRRLVADISHELKTPIAVIRASTDVIRAHGEEPVSNQEKWLDHITSETQRMSSMISDMLQLAHTDEVPPASLEVLDLSELAYGAALPFESLCFERGRELEILVEPDLYLRADRDALCQLISILLDNACKYSDEGGKIFFRVRGNSEKVILSVRNTGTPIPQESLPHIFDRFYRVDPARTRSEGSYGLGLAIAKKLTEDNGGKISAESSAESGNTFTCIFRRAKRPEVESSAEQ